MEIVKEEHDFCENNHSKKLNIHSHIKEMFKYFLKMYDDDTVYNEAEPANHGMFS